VLRSVVSGDGGDPDALRFVSRGAEATTGRWDLRPGERAYRLDDYGAPSFPGLVLAASQETIDERAPVVRAAIRALQRGYQQAQADPESAVEAIPGAGTAALAAQLDAVAPAFTAGAQGVGQLRLPVLREWAAWAGRFGATRRPVDVARAFDLSLVGRPPTAD
jgi:putative hydroxymethylpyrimidine transport system substrate-binding protein